MTTDKMCLLKPGEIESVQFKCGACGASVNVPVAELATGDVGLVIVKACPQCRTESGFRPGASDLEHLVSFNRMLGRLAEVLEGKNLQFGLKVKCPEWCQYT